MQMIQGWRKKIRIAKCMGSFHDDAKLFDTFYWPT